MKDDLVLDIMSCEEAKRELRALVDRWTKDERKKQMQLDTVRDAIDGFVHWGAMTKKEEVRRAKKLADAASRFSKEVKAAAPFWRYMARHAPSGQFEFETAANEIQMRFETEDAWLPTTADVLMRCMAVEVAARALSQERSKIKHMDENHLGICLAFAYWYLTGKQPAETPEASFEKPRTRFGHFVKLALLSSPEAGNPRVQKLLKTFVSFVERSVKYHKLMALPPD